VIKFDNDLLQVGGLRTRGQETIENWLSKDKYWSFRISGWRCWHYQGVADDEVWKDGEVTTF
jgi:hypothetical protein